MPPCSRGRTRRPPREGRGLWEQGRRPRRTTLPHLKQVVCRFPRRGWGGGGVYTGGCEEGRGRTAFKKPGAPAFLSRPGCEVALLQREDFSARGLGRGLTPWPERASPAPPPSELGCPHAPCRTTVPSLRTGSHLPFLGQGLPDYKQLPGPKQGLQTLGTALFQGWRAHGGQCLLQPRELEEGGLSCGALGPTPHCVICGNQPGNGQALSWAEGEAGVGKGQLGTSRPRGSCTLHGLG